MPRLAARLSTVVLICTIASVVIAWQPVRANVDLMYFRATSAPDLITLEWETASELDNLGFNILRALSDEVSEAQAINPFMIPSQVGGQPTGAYYEWDDDDVDANTIYYYWLQDVDFNGDVKNHGPVESALAGGSLIPTATSGDSAQPTAASTGTPQATPSPTTTPTVRSEASQTGSPQLSPSTPFLPTSVSSLPTSPPATVGQSEPTPMATIPGTTTEETIEAISHATDETQNGLGSSQNSEESVSTPAPVGSEAKSAEMVAESVQEPSPAAEISNQPPNEINAQIIGSSIERGLDSEKVETEKRGIFEDTTVLALVVLVIAFLLAMVASIVIWLVLSSKRVDSNNE